jgi:hypothetical protein
MTTFHLADAVTVSSPAPPRIIDRSGELNPPTTLQVWQMEVNGATTCTATFQPVGSLDAANSLPPQGTGGAWNNIGSAVTITCTTPGITPAVSTVTSAVPYTRWGCIVSAISGGGAATAKVEL